MKPSPHSSSSSSPAAPIRVLIVDDHFTARIGLAMPINQENDMQVVGEARTVEEAVSLYRELRPDVVTMDYRLPDGDGPSAVARIRAEFPEAKVLLFSAFDGEEPVYRALEAGVRGYLSKESDCAGMLSAIRAIFAGESVISEALLRKAELRRSRPSLTLRELEILKLLAVGNCNKQIADRLGFSESLIKQELMRVFDKLGAQDRAHAATLAIERGLLEMGGPT